MPVSASLSAALHLALFAWLWFTPEPLALQLADSEPAMTVEMVLLPASEPIPAPAAAVSQPEPTPEPLRQDEMAETHKLVKKPVKKPAATLKKPAAESQVTPAVERPAVGSLAAQAAEPVQAARHDAAYLNNPPPAYPPMSRRLGEEGRVLLQVRVSAEGRALSVMLKQSSGFARLDEAAKASAEKWRFVPARQGDATLASWVEVPVHFSLKK